MAAVIGSHPFAKTHASAHDSSATSPYPPSSATSYRSTSRPRRATTPRPHYQDCSPPAYSETPSAAGLSNQAHPSSSAIAGTEALTPTTTSTSPPAASGPSSAGHRETHASSTGGASRFPTPPSSSSPIVSTGAAVSDDAKIANGSMATQTIDSGSSRHTQATNAAPTNFPASTSTNVSSAPPRHQQQPSPPSDDYRIPSYSSTPLNSDDAAASQPGQQTVIHVRDLAHIQSLARANMLSGEGSGILNDPPPEQIKYEISAMPIGDIIEMVAALLTKITTTNDLQHDAMSRNVSHQQQANQTSESSGTGSAMNSLSHSVLAFHGKNVPAITILSYLSRIHKYCPTTFEVFLSLLVYFDRMTERVNELVTKTEEAKRLDPGHGQAQTQAQTVSTGATQQPSQDTAMRDDGDLADSDETDSDLADDDDDDDDMAETSGAVAPHEPEKIISVPDAPSAPPGGSATYFVVDSFNIHRLIIAGVTCASKFFSDVFYTNSRYAKVGGLPLAELNHLELQFLELNDFRLAVPVEDLEAYATMLVEFYAREVLAPGPAAAEAIE